VNRKVLRSILNQYLDWYDRADPFSGRITSKNRMESVRPPEQPSPDITQIADAARTILSGTLPSDFPAHFALSVLESVAYSTSRFAAADPANGILYRAAALQILEAGLPRRSESQIE
jgi:hypothetical protein